LPPPFQPFIDPSVSSQRSANGAKDMRKHEWMATTLAFAAVLGAAHFFSPGGITSHGGMAAVAADKSPAKVELPANLSETMKKFDVQTRKALAGDYETARYHPIHFKPAIDTSTKADCLTCHARMS
jgi:hypothetical protein